MSEQNFFTHDVSTEKKPWTHLDFGSRHGGEDFCFGIISDRTGRPRNEVFVQAIELFNRMRPDFVMSVGDFIEGSCMEDFSQEFLAKQWERVLPDIERSVPPFFYVPGNHDASFPKTINNGSTELWKRLFGVTHYHFIYKNTLFLCLNTGEAGSGIGEAQVRYAEKVLLENPDVRWTFVFMHDPGLWDSPDFAAIEAMLYERNYTVVAGHKHRYTKYVRNGRKYFMLGTTGAGEVLVGQGQRGVHFGEFDHVTWVSMCGGRPEFTNIALSGAYDENVVTTEKITWLTAQYFRANKKISCDEAERLRALGIDIEETEF